jgi:hypothetical protein
LTSSAAPQLEGDARAAVLHGGSHLQIIASAGSGKTEIVAQRFAQLMANGADPAGIIAFTFTKRAADELKARISAHIEERLGPASLGKLCAAFMGTIHSYCFRLLQQHVPRYGIFDVLDERRLTAFLCREEPGLHLRDLFCELLKRTRARCSSILADYEAVRRRSRPHPEETRAQTGRRAFFTFECGEQHCVLSPIALRREESAPGTPREIPMPAAVNPKARVRVQGIEVGLGREFQFLMNSASEQRPRPFAYLD